jgi:cation:H+ antiporter
MIEWESMTLWPAVGVMAGAFVVLAKCADWLVEGAIDIARQLKLPPMLIGIVIVSIGTTAPELAVSMRAALEGSAELALANAIGSVIYDDGLALPLVAFLAPVVVVLDRRVLRSTALFLIAVDLVAYAMCFDGTLDRPEGMVLLLGFCGYLFYQYWQQRGRKAATEEEIGEDVRPWSRIFLLFAVGLVGVLISSHGIVEAANVISRELEVTATIIGLILVALGTSVPEIATCIVSARKGHGSLAVGNILGADILNICWVAGASAVANDLVIPQELMHFMFSSMLVIVVSMLVLLRMNHRFEKWKGALLLCLCVAYLVTVLMRESSGVS